MKEKSVQRLQRSAPEKGRVEIEESQYPVLPTVHYSAPLPSVGYVRLPQILGNPKALPPIPPIIPVCRATWWAGVKSGRFPKPVKTLGPRIAAWRVEDIRALIDRSATCIGGKD